MALTKAQLIDLNANELILDLDADTSLTADTDDQIDIKIGGADDFTFTANAFNVLTGSHATFADSANAKFGTGSDMLVYHDGSNSYITNAVGALKIATETSGIALTIGHTTSEVTIADNLTVTGTLTLGSGAELTEAELEFLDGITAGTAAASKALVLDGSKDIGTIRNLTIDGTFSDGNYTFDTSGNVSGLGTVGSGAITSTGTVQGTTITATTAFVPDAQDGAALGTTSLQFSDLFLADSAVLGFGDDNDTTLTHTDGTGLTLNSTNKLCFNDASQFIQGASATVLDIAATDEIELTATLIDVVGNFTNSGTIVSAGVITAPSLVLGSTAVTSTPAELNLIDGGATVGTTAVADGDGILHNDGGAMKVTSATTFKTYFQEGISTAYDDLTTGDAAVTIDTSSGNITVDSNAGLVSIDGHTGVTLASSNSGDITLDSVADINLDAGGADIFFKAGGTTFGSATNTSGNLIIKSGTTTAATFSGANVTFAGTVGSGAITSTGIVTGTGFTAGSAVLAEAELELLDGLTAGTAIASKVVTTDGSIDTTGQRNLTISGELDAATLDISGAINVAGAVVLDGGAFVFNESSADVDFRVESNGSAFAITVDGGNDTVGLLSTTATQGADVQIGFHDTATTATAMGTAHANDATLLLGGANSGATQGSLYLGGQNISADGVEGAVYGFSGGSQNAGIEFLEGSGDAYGQISMKVGQGTGGTLVEGMKIDSAGIVTKPLQPAFMWLNAGGDTYAHDTDVDMIGDSEVFDLNADLSGSNGAVKTFTAPVTGKYFFSITTNMDAGGSASDQLIGAVAYIVCSNRKLNFGYSELQTDTYDHWGITGSGIIDMDANDTCKGVVYYKRGSGTGTAVTVGSSTDFRHGMSGFLVC